MFGIGLFEAAFQCVFLMLPAGLWLLNPGPRLSSGYNPATVSKLGGCKIRADGPPKPAAIHTGCGTARALIHAAFRFLQLNM
jgi:hypothetical protein